MKTVITVLTILVLALGLAACGGSPPSDSGGFTPAEQKALDFVVEHTPELEEIADLEYRAVQSMGDGDFDSATPLIETYITKWNIVKVEWEDFPLAGGKVSAIEMLFEDTANNLHDINSGIVDAIEYGDGSGAVAAYESYLVNIELLKEELTKLTGTEDFDY